MSLQDDIDRIKRQEKRLRFARFDSNTAWDIGAWLRDAAIARNLAIAFDIHCNGMTLMSHAMSGANPDNAGWIRRKRNLVLRMYASSHYFDLRMQLLGTTLEARTGLAPADFVAAGGGFPIHVEGAGCIGAIIVSGLTGEQDHDLAVEALAASLCIAMTDLA